MESSLDRIYTSGKTKTRTRNSLLDERETDKVPPPRYAREPGEVALPSRDTGGTGPARILLSKDPPVL